MSWTIAKKWIWIFLSIVKFPFSLFKQNFNEENRQEIRHIFFVRVSPIKFDISVKRSVTTISELLIHACSNFICIFHLQLFFKGPFSGCVIPMNVASAWVKDLMVFNLFVHKRGDKHSAAYSYWPITWSPDWKQSDPILYSRRDCVVKSASLRQLPLYWFRFSLLAALRPSSYSL